MDCCSTQTHYYRDINIDKIEDSGISKEDENRQLIIALQEDVQEINDTISHDPGRYYDNYNYFGLVKGFDKCGSPATSIGSIMYSPDATYNIYSSVEPIPGNSYVKENSNIKITSTYIPFGNTSNRRKT